MAEGTCHEKEVTHEARRWLEGAWERDRYHVVTYNLLELLDTLDRRPPGTPLVEAYRRHATLLRWVGVAVLVTFAVVRNLPSMTWLGSTA